MSVCQNISDLSIFLWIICVRYFERSTVKTIFWWGKMTMGDSIAL